MQGKDLPEKFVGYLHSNYPQKKELVSLLADILKIEKESVSRRLNDKVQFTAREIGIIAEKLDISLDQLLKRKSDSTLMSLDLIMPLSFDSIEKLVNEIGLNTNRVKELSYESLRLGYIFSSLPIEFYSPYEHLCKFMYFKWAYRYTKESLSLRYKNWQIPPEINFYHEELIDCRNNLESIFYIWDNPVIWNLVQEIDLFHKMRVISSDDVLLITKDLHSLLDNIEMGIRGIINEEKSFDLYISSINIGVSCVCYYSKDCSLIEYNEPFAWSVILGNTETFNKIYNWINSMKNVSTLISGSGAIDRRIFFDEQHKIVDSI